MSKIICYDLSRRKEVKWSILVHNFTDVSICTGEDKYFIDKIESNKFYLTLMKRFSINIIIIMTGNLTLTMSAVMILYWIFFKIF